APLGYSLIAGTSPSIAERKRCGEHPKHLGAIAQIGEIMMNRTIVRAVAAALLLGAAPVITQAQGVEQGRAIASSDVLSQISMFSELERPKSDMFLRGTPLAANAMGEAQVEYQDGNEEISAKVQDLPEPASLGPYTNYVLWALTPDGRAV